MAEWIQEDDDSLIKGASPALVVALHAWGSVVAHRAGEICSQRLSRAEASRFREARRKGKRVQFVSAGASDVLMYEVTTRAKREGVELITVDESRIKPSMWALAKDWHGSTRLCRDYPQGILPLTAPIGASNERSAPGVKREQEPVRMLTPDAPVVTGFITICGIFQGMTDIDFMGLPDPVLLALKQHEMTTLYRIRQASDSELDTVVGAKGVALVRKSALDAEKRLTPEFRESFVGPTPYYVQKMLSWLFVVPRYSRHAESFPSEYQYLADFVRGTGGGMFSEKAVDEAVKKLRSWVKRANRLIRLVTDAQDYARLQEFVPSMFDQGPWPSCDIDGSSPVIVEARDDWGAAEVIDIRKVM